jgi:glycylpeptide N-tetradecanoyltransferase
VFWRVEITNIADPKVWPADSGKITDLLSYYTLPSTVIGNNQYNTLKAAFMYYTFTTREGALPSLITDGLILAHSKYVPKLWSCRVPRFR